MSYFAAVLTPKGRTWTSCDADLQRLEDLDDLVDIVRERVGEQTGLVVLEREDEWFALVRVDGDDDARVFVSDLPAARASAYAGVFDDPDVWSDAGSLRAAGLVRPGFEDDLADDPDEDEDSGGTKVTEVPWAGDLSLLEDLGVGATSLKAIVEDDADDPARALTEIGERVGFLDRLETLR